jgi:hypothetical protein
MRPARRRTQAGIPGIGFGSAELVDLVYAARAFLD